MREGGAKMRAVVRGPRGATVEAVERPARPDGQVRLRVRAAGLCRTDIAAAEGRLGVTQGRVLGHELCAEVIETSPQSKLQLGARVTVNPLVPCLACPGCAVSPERCHRPAFLGLGLDGAFADELVVPAHAVLEVPGSLSDLQAAFVEPVAASLAVLDAPISPADRGLVFGEGRIAELTHRVLRARGFERVARATSAAELEANAYDFCVETAPDALGALVSATRPFGVLVLKSRPPAPAALPLAEAVNKSLALHAVRYGPFAEAIALMGRGRLPVDDLFGQTFALEQAPEAFARARESEASKLFLRP